MQWIAFKLMKNRNRLKIWIANMICSVIFWLHGFHTFPKLADNGPTISVASSVLQSSDNYFQEISSIFLSVTMEKRAEGKMLINCLVGCSGWLDGLVGWLVGWLDLVACLLAWLVGLWGDLKVFSFFSFAIWTKITKFCKMKKRSYSACWICELIRRS